MKFIKYSKYTGDEADSVDLDTLMKALADYLLQSGFQSDMYGMYEMPARPQHGRVARSDSPSHRTRRSRRRVRAFPRLISRGPGARDRTPHAAHAAGRTDHRRCAVRSIAIAECAGTGRARGRGRPGALRTHRQVDRLSGLQYAERFARVAREIQFRTPRHARHGDGRRGVGRIASIRIRRHD